MGEIDISSLKPNSNKYKNSQKDAKEKKKLEPIVKKGAVKQKKKSSGWFKKVVEFFADEDIEDGDVKSYILDEWVIPGIKDILWDIAATLLGDGKRSRRHGRRSKDYTSYYRSSLDGFRKRHNRERSSKNSRDRRSSNKYELDSRDVDYRDIVLDSRRDAEKIVDSLKQRIDEYGEVTVAELFDLCNIAGEYTDNDWGWTSPRDIGIKIDRGGGYLIDVAEARYLKD